MHPRYGETDSSCDSKWHALKKKIDRAGEGPVPHSGEPDSAGVPATPKSKKRKSTANDEGDDDEADGEPATPAKSVKKGRKPKAPSAAAKAKAEVVASIENPDEEMGEHGTAVKDEADGEDEGAEERKVKDETADDD